MLKRLQNLAKREASGALSGKQLAVGGRVVKVDRLLGEGGFATIYRCTDVESGAVYALKHYILTGYPDAERDAATEVGVMEALAGCPHVVRLHEAAFGGPPGAPATAAFALMDFCPDTLVAFMAQRSWRLDDYQLLRVALPVAHAVAAMHALQPPLAHRDLKAENVLLGAGGQWVLCDFGSASANQGVLESAREIAMEEEVVRRYTTPAYRAPELYDLYAREFIGLPVDIWALGVLLYLLAFGRLPFEGEAKLQVLNGRYAMPEGRPEPLRALIRDCLTVSPRQRPTIQQVLARLEALAPADLLAAAPGSAAQQLHQQQQPAAGASAAAAIASSNGGSTAPPPPLHTRIPSQGWADFGSDAGSAASPGSGANGEAGSGPHSRHHSGSLASWATFSPKRAAEVAVGAPAAVAASVGSFWSSFGEETPSDVQEPLVLATQQGGAAQQPQQQAAAQQPQQQAAAVGQPPRASPAQTPAPAPAAPRQAVAASAAAAGAGTAAVSPLSAGLARMSLGSTSPMPAQRQQPPSAQSEAAAPVPQPPAEGRGPDASDETQMLREHCRVLEQLLEGKTAEIALLHKQAEQQAAEIRTLRQRALQAETAAAAASKDRQQPAAGQGSSMAASAVPAATAASTAASTPTSSRIGQDVPQLQVPGGSDSWISFGGGGSRDRDAPTPTLLQPATGSFHGSSGAAAAPAATPTPPHPTEEALRKRLDLSSKALVGTGTRASAGLLVSPYDEPQRQPPMRGSSSSRQPGAPAAGGAAMSSDASGLSSSGSGNGNGLHSLPVQLTPGASPLQQGTRSAPPSAKPSPTRTSSIDVPANADADSLQQPSSPKHSRPGSSLTGRSLSPTKGHKRNLTAPGAGFFEDLDPLA